MEKELSEKYKAKLKKINIGEVHEDAWDFETLMDFLNDPESDNFTVLGGDIFVMEMNQVIIFTYDNWSLSPREVGESFSEYCKRSKKYAIEYLKIYPFKKNNLIVLVMTSEVTAGM